MHQICKSLQFSAQNQICGQQLKWQWNLMINFEGIPSITRHINILLGI